MICCSDIPEQLIDVIEDLLERVIALEKHQVAEYKVFKNYYMNYIESMKKIKVKGDLKK